MKSMKFMKRKKNEKRIKKQSITKAQKTNDKERVKRHSDRKTAKKCWLFIKLLNHNLTDGSKKKISNQKQKISSTRLIRINLLSSIDCAVSTIVYRKRINYILGTNYFAHLFHIRFRWRWEHVIFICALFRSKNSNNGSNKNNNKN